MLSGKKPRGCRVMLNKRQTCAAPVPGMLILCDNFIHARNYDIATVWTV